MKSNTIAIALASLLVGGVAVGAYHNSRDAAGPELAGAVDARTGEPVAETRDALDYADVVDVRPITETGQLYATVLGSEPIRETMTSSSPREVCQDVVVQASAPVKDPNRITGTVAGALIGGLVGNQVGGGDGRKVATAAGAVGGAYAGRHIQQNQQNNRVVERVERQCHTVQDSSQSTRVVAYNVTYRNPDGTTGSMRTDSKPSNRILLGDEERTVGYDVTYVYDGSERTIRMDERPEDRLPVINGRIMTAALDTPPETERQ